MVVCIVASREWPGPKSAAVDAALTELTSWLLLFASEVMMLMCASATSHYFHLDLGGERGLPPSTFESGFVLIFVAPR